MDAGTTGRLGDPVCSFGVRNNFPLTLGLAVKSRSGAVGCWVKSGGCHPVFRFTKRTFFRLDRTPQLENNPFVEIAIDRASPHMLTVWIRLVIRYTPFKAGGVRFQYVPRESGDW